MLSSRFKKYIQDYFLNKYSLKPELRLGKGIRILVTFNLVCFAWIFFRANSISDAGLLIKNLFEIPLYHVNNRTIITNLFLIALLITVQIIQERTGLRKLISKWPVWFRWPAYYVLLLLSIFWGIFDTTQFIYFQF